MAQAERVGEPRYVLTLTEEEAQTLFDLIGWHVVGLQAGDGAEAVGRGPGRRINIDHIWDALKEIGLNKSKPIDMRGLVTID